ncbi:MAG: hypothetical protein DME24_07675 [Verrucomicrobia bacterium]|nr:MAG: hypothetical protein DME24_07675 [Verrucomicrobiota bacterium]
MIANFFQSLSDRGVEYLLISGQATVLYGAATFSEDIDLWINPTSENRDRFSAALRNCRARFYKLTPRLTVENLSRGHGFHFVLAGVKDSEVFLDVMGSPPRVGSFAASLATARWMETEWGAIRTIGLQPLVELKKTQRLEDYPIISKLSLAWFDQPECSKTPGDVRWALQNIFTLPELRIFFAEHAEAVDLSVENLNPVVTELGRQLRSGEDVRESVERQVNEWMQQRIADLQLADRRYWREIIAKLKRLRATGKLAPEGSEV